MTVLVQIAWFVVWMIVMFAWIVRCGFITVIMLVEIARFVAWMIMILAGGFLRHYNMSFDTNGGSTAALLDADKVKSCLP